MNRLSRLASRASSSPIFSPRRRAGRRVAVAALESIEARRLFASVAGVVFNDANANGKRDAGEAGLVGEVVYADRNNNGIYDGTGAAADVATRTDASGAYKLANLPADGATITIRVRGDTGSRVVSPAGNGYVVKLTTATPDLTGKDFAVGPTASQFGNPAGFVYADVDKNGTYTTGDLPGVGSTVFADLNGNGKLDAGEPSAKADDRGYYALTHVPVTGKPLTFVALVDAKGTTGTAAYTVQPSTAFTYGYDVKYAPPANLGTIAGTVYGDANGNGKVDGTDVGLGDEVVYLDRNNNARQDAGEVATRTTPGGQYTFGSVVLDGSTVTVRLRGINAPRTVTAPAAGGYVLTLNAASMKSGLNFSVAPAPAMPQTAIVTGSIYDDANGNGQRDAGEAGLVGRYGQFGVYADLNRDGVQQPNEPYVYSEAGSSDYALIVPVGATFDVRFSGLSPADDGLYQTGPAGFNRPPLTLTTTSDALIANANFGFLSAGTIVADAFVDANGNGKVDLDGVTSVSDPRSDGGVFWLDLDGDHRRDANEPLVPVLLRNDENPGPGRVSLGVPYGTYTVAYSYSTAPNALADGTTIVTSSPSLGGAYAKILVAPIAPGVSGLAFRDDNGDGVREAYETPLSFATIYADYNNNGKLDGDEPSTSVAHPYTGETNDASYYLPVAAGRAFTLRLDAPNVAPGTTYALTLSGAQQATATFAAAPLRATVRGRVYTDANGNGVFDAGDTPLASAVVYADLDGDGVYDHDDLATRTDANGYYALNNVVRDAAYIRLRGVDNTRITQSGSDAFYSLSLPAEGASGIDFGVRPTPPK